MRTRTHTREPETPAPTRPRLHDPRAIARVIVPDPGPPKPPGPLAPLKPRKPYKVRSELRPKGGGTYRTDDGVFVAEIGEDGRVKLTDKPNFNVRLNRPCIRCAGDALRTWYENPKGYASRDERAVKTRTVTILGGGFDLTDWAMRSSGQDPYSARKLAFMDRTRNERVSIAVKHQSESLRNSVARLKSHLGRVWRFERWPPAHRRRVLFELWDECAEKGSSQVLDASAAARATIIAFIRRELPAGSTHAYSRTELSKLNARRTSKARFAPY